MGVKTTPKKVPTPPSPFRPQVIGSTPAFPHSARGHAGITYRAWLAVNAPKDIPDWFKAMSNRMPNPAPKVTELPEYLSLEQESEDRKLVDAWLRDDIFELPDHLAWASQAAERYHEAQAQIKEHANLTRYFTWPWHWADMMIRAEEQTAQANFMQNQMELALAQQQRDAAERGERVPTQ